MGNCREILTGDFKTVLGSLGAPCQALHAGHDGPVLQAASEGEAGFQLSAGETAILVQFLPLAVGTD